MTSSDTVEPIPERGRVGPLSLAQILVAEGSLLAIVAAATQGILPMLITTVAAALPLAVFFARSHGRWWLEHRALTRDHERRRSARRENEAGPVLAALRTIAPGLTVRDITAAAVRDGASATTRDRAATGRDSTAAAGRGNTAATGRGNTAAMGSSGTAAMGRDSAAATGRGNTAATGRDSAAAGDEKRTTEEKPTGVARDEAGWFGVVALDQAGPVPLDTLIGALSATDQPGLVLQLVTHTVPAPTPDLPPASPAIASYRQLGDAAPAHRETSLSVRLDAKALAESVLDHTTDPAEAARLTAALTRKIATTLRRQGITSRVLDAAELLDTLARSCDARVPDVAEEWTHWRSNHLIHRTYWLETWPKSTTEMGPLLAWASTAPASQTSVAVVLDASKGGKQAAGIAVRAFIRLATRPDADLDALGQVLSEGVRRAGGELRSLDGEQGIAAYATAPTGGGAG